MLPSTGSGRAPTALRDVPDGEPLVVCLQAGNLHSGSFGAFPDLVSAAHDRGAWVTVSNAATTEDDVRRTVEAVRRAVSGQSAETSERSPDQSVWKTPSRSVRR